MAAVADMMAPLSEEKIVYSFLQEVVLVKRKKARQIQLPPRWPDRHTELSFAVRSGSIK